ncbi:recombinase family protein [Noviherbaspirillum sp. Root189]|uniref:recombinase family protein n=1 Tax=Noviherbaspirillum sp. Root189 TaxID=1736487 RepID=UPI0009EBACC7
MSWTKFIEQQLRASELLHKDRNQLVKKRAAADISRTTWYDRAAVLARISQCRQRGKTFSAIASELNRQGLRGRNGARWYSSSVRAFLVRHQ